MTVFVGSWILQRPSFLVSKKKKKKKAVVGVEILQFDDATTLLHHYSHFSEKFNFYSNTGIVKN